jgi:hypothetical protein
MKNMMNMVLTSLVNSDYIVNRIIEDMNIRFNTNIDKDKLVKYLSTYECSEDKDITNAW